MSTSDRVNELLAMTDLVLSKKPEHSRPQVAFIAYSFLTKDSQSIKEKLVNYWDEIPEFYIGQDAPPDTTVIIHGHLFGTKCFTPYYCHELGYKPSNTDHPAFRKQFQLKWGKAYAK